MFQRISSIALLTALYPFCHDTLLAACPCCSHNESALNRFTLFIVSRMPAFNASGDVMYSSYSIFAGI